MLGDSEMQVVGTKIAIFAAMLDSPPPVKGVSIIAMPNAASVIPAKSNFNVLFMSFALCAEFVDFLLYKLCYL